MSSIEKNGYREQIVELLSKNPKGLTISFIAKEIGAHRHTARKYILKMNKQGLIEIRDLRTLKLCYLSKENEDGS